ncbi:hypothetical protein SAMN05192583_1194 [Sphingomonas gellani]|uniref:Peptidase MA superfamily protein n=2 Tax=Sphingomonas gellani TaxID=1166340 RepID=A0A1H8B746_9SPHN|nr:hypothetical protein SAMN05192583_1194 [Sphingomonas gellani]
MLAAVLYVPAALAFPYRAQFGATTVLSDVPIAPNMPAVLARADRLLAASPIDQPGIARTVVLTDGGWRWRVLSLTAAGGFGLRRPFGTVLTFNRSDVAADRVFNDAPVANQRTLSGTIAHETTHILVARHVGEWREPFLPSWKAEGYADYVSQESSLKPGDAARLRASDPHAPALAYFDARRRVAAELARNGGSVDRLFGL